MINKTEHYAKLPLVCSKCRRPIKTGVRYYIYEGEDEFYDFEQQKNIKGEYKREVVCSGCEIYDPINEVPF